MWCIAKVTPQYIALMEHLVHLYALDADALCPLVCFDEKSYQVIGDVLTPIEMKPGQVKKESEKWKRF